jgi:hypothetical protein
MRTIADLKAYINARIYTNNAKAITATKHAEALIAVVDNLNLDLATTSEQLTGEIYAGKPVYSQMKSASFNTNNDSDFEFSFTVTGGVSAVWVDAEISRAVFSNGGAVLPLIAPDEYSIKNGIKVNEVYGNNIICLMNWIGQNNNAGTAYCRIKYTKA